MDSIQRPPPRICCLDLDTFFVSVERLFDPSLIGKPVVVGGRPGERGVVTASSYEVRAFGVRSGMSLTEAARLAPHAIFVPTRHGVYGDYSERVRAIVERVCPVVRMASIDEMYLDFAGCEQLYRRASDASDDAAIERIVRETTAAIDKELGLPASAGIATSKRVAKVACGLAKPKGVRLVPAGTEREFLAPLPVRKFPGIGPVAESRLAAMGIKTLGELATSPRAALSRVFGSLAESLHQGVVGQAADGLGRERPAFREHDPDGETVGSISNERTFREDVRDRASIDSVLGSLCERVCWRARNRGVKARTVTLKLRYSDFQTISRSRSITPTHADLELYPVVAELFDRSRTRRLAIRLLGVALSNLGAYDEQPGLFRDSEPLYEAVDALRERFGYEAVRLATSVERRGNTVGGAGR
ncbi:MAG: DNA polymerase IV [Deltaproteobacteria bacterium]|nr:DNA polymerase IV [Deltaproteobacteria bacterium]